MNWENPSVAQQLLFATVRLETRDASDQPLSVGTSFVLAHEFVPGKPELFLVSNKHVVDGAASALLYFTRRASHGGPSVGDTFFVRIDDFALQWHGHPDSNADVAVYPLGWQLDLIERGGETPYLMRLSSTMLISAEAADAADPFMPVVFVGYPNGLFDEKNYTPILRQATLATPLGLDFCGDPVFLIDGSVFPGSSGSPVYSYDLSIKGQIIDIRLIGILSAVFTQADTGDIVIEPAPVRTRPVVAFRQIIDLGVVMQARLIREAIEDFGRAQLRQAST